MVRRGRTIATIAKLTADGRAGGLHPLNHGNAWSIYFQDPEGNGLEIFCDSPWGVRQPQGKPWDLSMSEDALRRQTEEQFKSEPDFRPMEEFFVEQILEAYHDTVGVSGQMDEGDRC